MFKRCLFIVIALMLIVPSLAQAETAKNKVYLIGLSGAVINPVTAEYIENAIAKAESDDAEALIIELDTPGGLLTSTREIIKKMMASTVPIAVYVAPSGARAGSAGVFITLAGNIAAMAPSTNIGAAHPVSLHKKRSLTDALEDLYKRLKRDEAKKGGGSREAIREPETPMEEKILNDTTAWVRSIAQSRGRNAAWAVKAVTESVSIPDTEAVSNNVVDFVASSEGELLKKMDGKTVEMPEGKVTLRTVGAAVVRIPMSLRQKILLVLASPNISYILLMLGFYGLLFEFTHPGIGFPGVAGTIAIIIGFYGLHLLNANYAGVALIVLAIILFIMEVKIVSYGLLTLGGIVSLVLGSLMVFDSPYSFMRVSIPLVVAFSLATMLIVIFLISIVVRSHRRKIVTGSEGLVGVKAEIKNWGSGRGKVFVHGELWNAEGEGNYKRGDIVEVVRLEGMKLIIKRPAIRGQGGRHV